MPSFKIEDRVVIGIAAQISQLPSDTMEPVQQRYAEAMAYYRGKEDYKQQNAILDEIGKTDYTIRIIDGIVLVYDHLQLNDLLEPRIPSYFGHSDPDSDHPNMAVAKGMGICTVLWSKRGQVYVQNWKRVQVTNMVQEVLRKLTNHEIKRVCEEFRNSEMFDA
jgi:hypothetical protein